MKNPSKPSAPPSPASGREPPASGWPIPQPGDCLNYSYLWSHEAEAGQEEGRKDRPVAVVVATHSADGSRQVLVAPITHRPPERTGDAIEIPKSVKRDLGLDDERSWIVIGEINRFIWPGPDVRVVAGGADPYYGAIPDWLFVRMRDGILDLKRRSSVRMIKRTE